MICTPFSFLKYAPVFPAPPFLWKKLEPPPPFLNFLKGWGDSNYDRSLSEVKTLTRIYYKSFFTNPFKVKLEFVRNFSTIFRSSHVRCSIQKAVFKNFVIFTKETSMQVFSREICKIFKNTFGGCSCCQVKSKETK